MGSVLSTTKRLILLGALGAAAGSPGLRQAAGYVPFNYETLPASSIVAPDKAPTDSPLPGVIHGYRTWTRVNSTPFRVSPSISVLCAAPRPGEVSPHANTFIDVYVNEIGRSAMLSSELARFPEGSIIVKEKRHASQGAMSGPDLLTVMIKRSSGYNPKVGDWEFAAVDGKATEVQAQGKLATCMGCHKTTGSSDYVFRTYLPARHWPPGPRDSSRRLIGSLDSAINSFACPSSTGWHYPCKATGPKPF